MKNSVAKQLNRSHERASNKFTVKEKKIQAIYAAISLVFGLIEQLQLFEVKSTFFVSEQVIKLQFSQTNSKFTQSKSNRLACSLQAYKMQCWNADNITDKRRSRCR